MIKVFKKKRKGSLVVEASLVLPLVIVTLLFVVNILNICMIHVCMQQALNNTAKKISQNSYIIYRFAGENNYKKFINGLSDINTKYAAFEEKAKETKNKIGEFQNSVNNTMVSFETLRNTSKEVFGTVIDNKTKEEKIKFDIFKIDDFVKKFTSNMKDVKEKGKESINKAKVSWDSIVDLTKDGKENIQALAIKMMVDVGLGAGMTGIVKYIYDIYRKQLDIPTSKIDSINFLHSTLNDDGSFTFIISYKYNNPFSFINKESMEYSIINKTIRMTNAITIKPFIGKNGTSLVKDEANDENDDKDDSTATSSEIQKSKEATPSEINNDKKPYQMQLVAFHANKKCDVMFQGIMQTTYAFLYTENLRSGNATIVPYITPNGISIYEVGNGLYIPCPNCISNNDYSGIISGTEVYYKYSESKNIDKKINVFFHKNKNCLLLSPNIVENNYIKESNRLKKYKSDWDFASGNFYFDKPGYYTNGEVKTFDDGSKHVKIFSPCHSCCTLNSSGGIDSNKTYYSIFEEMNSFD